MKSIRVVLLIAALVLIPLTVSTLRAQQGTTGTPSATPTPTVNVFSRTMVNQGQQIGEVMVGNTVVFRLRESAGGYNPGERASIVASRLSTLLSQGHTWQDVRVGRQQNQTALFMGNSLLITADAAHAQYNRVTPTQLAYDWQQRTQTALRTGGVVAGTQEATGSTTPTTTTPVATAANQWPDWTNASTKIVPIISLGSPGLEVGAAQVTGPRERVNDVKAVLQLDLVFQKTATIRVFIPSSNITSLKRVQGVAVSALLQYRLFRF